MTSEPEHREPVATLPALISAIESHHPAADPIGRLTEAVQTAAGLTALADHLTSDPTADLRAVLSTAITDLAREYSLVPGDAPSSTVAMLRPERS